MALVLRTFGKKSCKDYKMNYSIKCTQQSLGSLLSQQYIQVKGGSTGRVEVVLVLVSPKTRKNADSEYSRRF